MFCDQEKASNLEHNLHWHNPPLPLSQTAMGINIHLPSSPTKPCFAQKLPSFMGQAPASFALQPLLGLPVTGSSGGYAHQTTLRLFSQPRPYIPSNNPGLTDSLSSAMNLRNSGARELLGASCRPGGVAWGWGSLVTGRKVAGGGGGIAV